MATVVYTLEPSGPVSVRRDDDAWTIELEADDELHLTTRQVRMIVDGYLAIATEDTEAEPTAEERGQASWLLSLPDDERRRVMDLAERRQAGAQ
jgi:hypothetical protein